MWGRIISTHALTEGDLEFFGLLKGDDISTHALTEGDHQPAATGSPVSYFNSRPHGGRLHWLFFFAHQAIFQLTPSRRVTLKLSKGGRLTIISTHALTEGDCLHQYSFTCVSHFNSRPHGGRPFFFDCVPILPYFNSRPHGGRRFGLPDEVPFDYISTHALTEGDPDFFLFIIVNCISTHALTEGDVERVSGISVPPFQLTPSRRSTSC